MREHVRVLEGLGAETRLVKRPADLDGLWGAVLPGGESTTIGMLMDEYGLREPLASGALPLFGTCAGLILMARRIDGGESAWLGLLDVTVVRNATSRSWRATAGGTPSWCARARTSAPRSIPSSRASPACTRRSSRASQGPSLRRAWDLGRARRGETATGTATGSCQEGVEHPLLLDGRRATVARQDRRFPG